MTDPDLYGNLNALSSRLVTLQKDVQEVLVEISIIKSAISPAKNLLIRDAVSRVVREYYGVNLEDIRSGNRGGNVRRSRQVMQALLRNYTNLSFSEIGKYTCREHASVMHSCKVIETASEINDPLYLQYRQVENKLKEKLAV